MYFGSLFLISFLSRLLLSSFLNKLEGSGTEKENVVIYGVDRTSIQLITALKLSKTEKVIALVDDNSSLYGALIAGYTVQSSEKLEEICDNSVVSKIIIGQAIIERQTRSELRRSLSVLNVELVFNPTVAELLGFRRGELNISDLIIPREKSVMSLVDMPCAYRGKTILLTGAGGSIASVICKELCKHKINKIILYEQSEFALYTIEKNLRSIEDYHEIEVLPILGSVCDSSMMDEVLKIHKPHIIFHAAAYKHVPIIEQNELVGLRNNVLGTQILNEAAIRHKIDRVVLISTDKAVRPTNVMGASKRIAELLVQGAQEKTIKTVFSSVRFGNVLESSGSAIPLFKEQIAKGGPVTITHKEVTRYFMTVEEASELVLLAGFMALGGEVFVLDMGKSMKIIDVAEKLIRAAGFEPTFDLPKNNQIQIKEIGLRAGEKLYEELLISENTFETPHPKILRAEEPALSSSEIKTLLKELNTLLNEGDKKNVRKFISNWVEGYQP